VTVRVIPPAEDLMIVNHVVRPAGGVNLRGGGCICRIRRSLVLHWWVEYGAFHYVFRAASVTAQRLPSPPCAALLGVLAYFIAVILWGTLVRATGAGAGCGNHWPLCNGTILQHSASVSTMIEFTHRITSGLSFFAVVGLLAWTLPARCADTWRARQLWHRFSSR